jgi:hypothetical protein
VANQSGAAEKKTFIPAFNDTISLPRRRGRIGRAPARAPDRTPGRKPAGACERRIKTTRNKPIDRRPGLHQNESGGADPAPSSQKSDLAFQHAMRCAMAQGLERPPRLGVVKDIRPLTAPRLFEPVPHSSGCTSPAQECADLVARND